MNNNYKIDPTKSLEYNRINVNLNKEGNNFLYQQEMNNDKKIIDYLSNKYEEEKKIKIDKKKIIQNEQFELYNNYMNNKYIINENKDNQLQITLGKVRDNIRKRNIQEKLNISKSTNQIINNSMMNYFNHYKINQINHVHGYNIINFEPNHINFDLNNNQNYTINNSNYKENNSNILNENELQIKNKIKENRFIDKYSNDNDYNDNKLQNNENIKNNNNYLNEEKLNESEYRTYNEYLNKVKNERKNIVYNNPDDNIRNNNNYFQNLNNISNSQFQSNDFQNNIYLLKNNIQTNINDRFYNDENYNKYIYHNKNQYEDTIVPLQNQMNRLTLEARNQYLLNKKKNSISYNNIYTKESKVQKDTVLNYNPFTIQKFQGQKKNERLKEYLDSQIESKKIYNDTYLNLDQKYNTNFQKKELIKNNNIYDEINEKNIKLKNINISPYSYWKNYSIGHFFAENKLNNNNNNKRLINERLQNLGNNIINP